MLFGSKAVFIYSFCFPKNNPPVDIDWSLVIMSQAKVDRYKEQKANRKKEVAKQRRLNRLTKLVLFLILAAIVVWAVFSIRSMVVKNMEAQKTYINLNAITDYLNGLDETDTAE